MDEPFAHEVQIDDGIYVSYNGEEYVLRAPRDEGDHWIVLDSDALAQFVAFVRTTMVREE